MALFLNISILIMSKLIISIVIVFLLLPSFLSIAIVSFVYAINVLMPIITMHVFYKL
jgi:hypothetical protein